MGKKNGVRVPEGGGGGKRLADSKKTGHIVYPLGDGSVAEEFVRTKKSCYVWGERRMGPGSDFAHWS